jgi:ABC-type polysaccharide/polyol phosphate transport system ATPase subunit
MRIPVRHLQERILLPHRKKDIWTTKAVHDVSLELSQGEWVGIYGPNGCGKTTLLRMLAGLLTPDSGSVQCGTGVSCFFELSIGFHEERTAAENVRMHAMLQGLNREETDTVLQSVHAFAGIADHWDLPMKCYSTGMRLRVGFAVATAAPSPLLLLDEILAVGDDDFQHRCKLRLADLKRYGHSAVVVSHGMGDLERMCDRILFMEKGCIVREQIVSAVHPKAEGMHM